MEEENIIREGQKHWLYKDGEGQYRIFQNRACHSVLAAIISFKGEDTRALEIANREFDRREALN